jgi:hypothetical protein
MHGNVSSSSPGCRTTPALSTARLKARQGQPNIDTVTDYGISVSCCVLQARVRLSSVMKLPAWMERSVDLPVRPTTDGMILSNES